MNKVRTSESGRQPVKVWIDDTEIKYVKDVEWSDASFLGRSEVKLTFIAEVEHEEWLEWEPGEYKTKGGLDAVVSVIDHKRERLRGYIKLEDTGWNSTSWNYEGRRAWSTDDALDLVK